MNYCLFTIKSGAGGVEAKDFTNMLFKMYCKFFNKNNIKYEIIDIDSEDIGLDSVSLKVNKDYKVFTYRQNTSWTCIIYLTYNMFAVALIIIIIFITFPYHFSFFITFNHFSLCKV